MHSLSLSHLSNTIGNAPLQLVFHSYDIQISRSGIGPSPETLPLESIIKSNLSYRAQTDVKQLYDMSLRRRKRDPQKSRCYAKNIPINETGKLYPSDYDDYR
jgi:hypothetical protein